MYDIYMAEVGGVESADAMEDFVDKPTADL